MTRRKCALITGATGGLGLAIAARLADDGCDIVLNGPVATDEMAAQVGELKTGREIDVAYDQADLRDPRQIAGMIDRVAGAFGAVDILVNNAVVRHFAPVEAYPVAHWDEALAVNLSAVFHTIRLVLPKMRENGWGRIISIGSPYSFMGAPDRIAYATTKAGLLGLTRTVALEAAGTDVTCNAVCPGTLPTPAIKARIAGLAAESGLSIEEATSRYLADRQPGGRFISLEAVAELIAFLCGPRSREITGAALPVDGGWTVS